ncbi:MAG: DNA primase [Stutzerimonas stutzeri]|nr:MAG: DNA primase [Stutzerimonas stutzeri]
MSRLQISEIEEQLDMEFFLERESLAYRVTRGSSGEQLNIRCCPVPSCRDARWRTYFGTETGRGNCFVCGKGFSKVGFIHEHLEHGDNDWGATFRYCEEALREQGWRPKRKAMVAVDPGAIQLPASDPLPLEDGSNLQYLEQRGFDGEIARYFDLRWCQFGWWRYRDADGAQQTQNFGNRVLIPVYDLDGILKTFQGRDLTGTSSMKYLFPKELPGTGRYLLNAQNAVATTHVVMGEGAFDVAAIKVAYDQDQDLRDIVPIGSFGKHLSYGSQTGDDQLGRFLALKARGVKTVTIMWDGEEKALLAALSAAKLLTGAGFVARIALLPYDKDPNEVPGEVVRRAHYAATVWTPTVDVRWRLRNPYAPGQRGKLAA